MLPGGEYPCAASVSSEGSEQTGNAKWQTLFLVQRQFLPAHLRIVDSEEMSNIGRIVVTYDVWTINGILLFVWRPAHHALSRSRCLPGYAKRGRSVLLVFAMQGVGNLTATLVVIICLSIFGTDADELEPSWRIAFGFGAIPVFYRLYR